MTTDAERLRIALVNLLVNARQAVNGTGGNVSLSTPRANADTRARSSVADDGDRHRGRPTWRRVFDPYFTTKRGGTGLGLPIAKNIVEGLGGTLGVPSTPGKGTEIRIDLPLETPLPVTAAAADRLAQARPAHT